MTFEQAAFYVSILTLLLIGVGNLLVLRQIRSEQEWNRRNASQELLFNVILGRFGQMRRSLEEKVDIYDDTQTWATVKDKLTRQDMQTLDAILNYLEVMCLCVKNNVIDNDITFDAMDGIMFAYLRWAGPYIKVNRAIDAKMWTEIDGIATKWREKRAEIEQRAQTPGKRKL